MQEEITRQSLAYTFRATKITAKVLARVAKLILLGGGRHVLNHGKMSVKRLVRRSQGVSSMEINCTDVREFRSVLRKYGVNFALHNDPNDPAKKTLFFQTGNSDVLNVALADYTARVLKRSSRPSILEQLHKHLNAIQKSVSQRIKNKVLER